jgi:AcrR family transcriptional regulator
MSISSRKERERTERRQRIIDSARELAEAEGWEAVTVRRLAERIEYSQPVLYSHFASRSAIVAAVAEQGFADLAGAMARARAKAKTPPDALRLGARAYLDFASANPARYDAMFSMSVDLVFGLDARKALRDGFGELEAMFRPFAAGRDLGARTEVAWASLHGLATLERAGRLRPELRDRRLQILVAEWLP